MAVNTVSKRDLWKEEEVNVMLEAVEKRKQIIRGDFSNKITKQSKVSAWREIKDELFVRYGVQRSKITYFLQLSYNRLLKFCTRRNPNQKEFNNLKANAKQEFA